MNRSESFEKRLDDGDLQCFGKCFGNAEKVVTDLLKFADDFHVKELGFDVGTFFEADACEFSEFDARRVDCVFHLGGFFELLWLQRFIQIFVDEIDKLVNHIDVRKQFFDVGFCNLDFVLDAAIDIKPKFKNLVGNIFDVVDYTEHLPNVVVDFCRNCETRNFYQIIGKLLLHLVSIIFSAFELFHNFQCLLGFLLLGSKNALM